jgi:hypothetical protein
MQRDVFKRHALAWATRLATQPSLTDTLADFAENKIKYRAFSTP